MIKKWVRNKSGSLYSVALAIIAVFAGGIAYTFAYYVYNRFYVAVQPQLDLSVQGTSSLQFANNLWDSMPLIFIIVIGFYLYTVLQRRREEY